MKPRTLTPRVLQAAERHLASVDPVMARIIAEVGRCRLGRSRREDPFTALVEAVVWQQLSTRAASTIYGRVLALAGDSGLTPAALLACSDEQLRGAGLSRSKISFLRDLATRATDGSLTFDALADLEDDEVVATLTQIKGIGRWTAEMFLMFRLLRPDVLPVGDLGIVKAMQRHYRIRKTTPDRLYRLAEPWRPYRSVASWYLWASTDVVPGNGKP